jgi:hypothetical protein
MRFGTPTLARLERVIDNMRHRDRLEVMASDAITSRDAVLDGWRRSNVCECILDEEDQAVGVCGLNGNVIWMLGTDELTATPARRRQLVRDGILWVDALAEMQREAHGRTLLHNYVHAANLGSIRWLQALGFTVADRAEPRGPSAQLFRYFWRTD